MATTITDLRDSASTPFDIAVALPPDADPEPHVAAGATWRLPDFSPETL